ncbi:hypothetical protein WKI68_37270 [Streptomyces sp. MS1.HAVA.3]|uniref:Lipoprotein n=1 Tax=Streptomyces caledonius TaxID=3134107 RepID=A0ABU8UBV2_9ACTN
MDVTTVPDAPRRSVRSSLAPYAGLLASTAVLLTGCSAAEAGGANPDTPGKPIAIGQVPKITDAEQLTLPLDAYQLSPRDARKVQDALDTLVTDCMTKQGFAWAPPQRPPVREGSRNGRRYGLLDPEEGSQTGYHVTGTTGQGAKGKEQGQDGSATAQEAAGQCVLTQRAKLNGQQKADKAASGPDELVERLVVENASRAERDPQVRAVWSQWSDCMDQAGYSYDGPWDSNNDREFATPEPTDKERAVASADAKCKQKHNVAGVWMAVETAYQKRAIETNAEALEEARKANETRLRNAADALGQG